MSSTVNATIGGLARALPRGMLLAVSGGDTAVVTGLAYDSRRVAKGDLFFCVTGGTTDGHLFVDAAVSSGAAALVTERPTGAGIPEIQVTSTRQAMPLLAAAALGDPADDLLLLGVTGTNGKTTTAFLLEAILRADGRLTGLIGTIETRVGEIVRPGIRTTPESVDLQQLLAEMRDAGVSAAAMEVTSHALVLNRVDGVRFAAAAFTNLTQDHLDFHRDMEDYFHAKRELFTPERLERGAVNVDDPYGERLVNETSIPMIGFGIGESAEVRASDIDLRADGSTFRVSSPKGEVVIETSLVGPFNVSNCLAAVATALQAGIGLEAIEQGIRSLAAVPGRFESVIEGQPFAAIVDYAHTPDSLDNVLVAAKRLAAERDGKVICAFGCGGDRDKGKRPLMGMVAARLADVIIVTSDNPRSEDPESILGQILEGVISERVDGADAVLVDRREAIAEAISRAGEKDVVVIAGKGHETGQEFADHTIPFDDRDVVREILRQSGWGR